MVNCLSVFFLFLHEREEEKEEERQLPIAFPNSFLFLLFHELVRALMKRKVKRKEFPPPPLYLSFSSSFLSYERKGKGKREVGGGRILMETQAQG